MITRLPGYLWERNMLRRNRPAAVLSEPELERLERYFETGRITANAVADLIATVREAWAVSERRRQMLERYQGIVDAAGASRSLLQRALGRERP